MEKICTRCNATFEGMFDKKYCKTCESNSTQTNNITRSNDALDKKIAKILKNCYGKRDKECSGKFIRIFPEQLECPMCLGIPYSYVWF